MSSLSIIRLQTYKLIKFRNTFGCPLHGVLLILTNVAYIVQDFNFVNGLNFYVGASNY